jgi:hypothetical protein
MKLFAGGLIRITVEIISTNICSSPPSERGIYGGDGGNGTSKNKVMFPAILIVFFLKVLVIPEKAA